MSEKLGPSLTLATPLGQVRTHKEVLHASSSSAVKKELDISL